jgi:RNA ligase (TIGR02306 family)
MSEIKRKLARVVPIDAVEKHPNADSLDICTVGGWKVVTKLGEYQAGDLAVYCEVDSFLPHELAPFLSKGNEPREFNGVKGERLRTVRLRKQLSQGLLLPMSVLSDYANGDDGDGNTVWYDPCDFYNVDEDVTEILGIQKWEPPVPTCLTGMMRGNFPSAVPKTDQERVQNLVAEVAEAVVAGHRFEVTEKLEGSSCTMFLDCDADFHVCSRNLDLKEDDTNSFWRAAKMYAVESKMRSAGLREYAIQGELIGNKLNGNIYRLNEIDFYVYDVYDTNTGRYLLPAERRQLVHDLELKHVPVLDAAATLGTVQELLDRADGQSKLYPTLREGIVFKQIDGSMTFKAISNQYLISEK